MAVSNECLGLRTQINVIIRIAYIYAYEYRVVELSAAVVI
jgi:hypothetical protein